MMKKILFASCFLGAVAFLMSCESITTVKVSCLTPAKYNFPEQIRRVGIVNNTHTYNPEPDKNAIDTIPREVVSFYRFGEGKMTTETLADAIADQKYFDEVVICDSALRAKDGVQRTDATLTQDEVADLVDGLRVDAIISLENVDMTANKAVFFQPAWNAFEGLIDMTITPTINVYVPTRTRPLYTISDKDSINWKVEGTTLDEAYTQLPSDKSMISQASEYAGTIPVKSLVPHWVDERRAIFTDDVSSDLKNGAALAKDDHWDEAGALWTSLYNKTNDEHRKMQMAINIAVYQEMTNHLEDAAKWVETARKHLFAKNKTTSADYLTGKNHYYYEIIDAYAKILKERVDQLPILNAQMARFDNEKQQKE
jgi:hypothetical protein